MNSENNLTLLKSVTFPYQFGVYEVGVLVIKMKREKYISILRNTRS